MVKSKHFKGKKQDLNGILYSIIEDYFKLEDYRFKKEVLRIIKRIIKRKSRTDL